MTYACLVCEPTQIISSRDALLYKHWRIAQKEFWNSFNNKTLPDTYQKNKPDFQYTIFNGILNVRSVTTVSARSTTTADHTSTVNTRKFGRGRNKQEIRVEARLPLEVIDLTEESNDCIVSGDVLQGYIVID